MTQYTLIHQNGMPLINNVTTEPESYVLEDGQRLLADVPPEYDIETQALIRLEPVPIDALEITYTIIPKPEVPDVIKDQFNRLRGIK
jgi:hypothetical protein